jgi:hypothetical protein
MSKADINQLKNFQIEKKGIIILRISLRKN